MIVVKVTMMVLGVLMKIVVMGVFDRLKGEAIQCLNSEKLVN